MKELNSFLGEKHDETKFYYTANLRFDRLNFQISKRIWYGIQTWFQGSWLTKILYSMGSNFLFFSKQNCVRSNMKSSEYKYTYQWKWIIFQYFNNFSKHHRRCSVRKDVLRNFTKFAGKHLCQILLFNKVSGWGLQLY